MILTDLVDISMANLISYAPILFMVALGVFVGALVLKSAKMVLAELILFLLMAGLNMDISAVPAVAIVLGVVQMFPGLLILYRLYKALDYNYRLILEKTHQSPRVITRNGNNGTRRSF